MTRKKCLLEEMTAPEFRERMAEDPVILLPLGSQEVQGPCNPMGDFMLARRLAAEVAERTGAIAAPTVPFGYADNFRSVPGGIQFSPDVFCGVLRDFVGAFLDHGLTRLLVFNGHTGNQNLISQTLHRVRRERGTIVPWLNIWPLVNNRVREQAHGKDYAKAHGHGADPIGSVYQYLAPELRRPDLADPVNKGKTLIGLQTGGLYAVRMGEIEIGVPIFVSEHTDGTVSGDTSLSDAEAGKIYADYIVEAASRVVEHLRTADLRDPAAGRAN